MRGVWGIVFVLLFLASCAVRYAPQPHIQSPKEQEILSKLYSHYEKWKGVKYCFGGLSMDGVDCSGFIYLLFREQFHLILPRGTRRQRNVGETVSINELRAGDLIFFKTGYNQRHVGIYMESGTFMHASGSSGVRLSDLSMPYWLDHFRFAKRVEKLWRK